MAAFVPAAVEQGFNSVIAVPMRVHGRLVGAVNVFGTIHQPAGGSLTRMVQAMTDLTAIAIGQAQSLRGILTLLKWPGGESGGRRPLTGLVTRSVFSCPRGD